MDKWDQRFMELAWVISNWASCFKPNRKIGCVIVKNKRIVTTGYNGAPAGIKTCVERGECLRKKIGIASGTHAELCYAVHAEQNAIIQAAKLGSSIEGATLYCTHQPCVLCAEDDRQRRHHSASSMRKAIRTISRLKSLKRAASRSNKCKPERRNRIMNKRRISRVIENMRAENLSQIIVSAPANRSITSRARSFPPANECSRFY